jgi:transcription elongation factor GreA
VYSLPDGFFLAAHYCAEIAFMSDRIPMTRAGYDKVKAELDHLHTVELPKILERLALARSEGDLSENAEYHGAQESRMLMEAKINDLRDKISRAVIVDPSLLSSDEVAFGCTVAVKDLDLDEREEFTLVGMGEEDLDTGKINVSSPLAQGLMGKKVGQTADITVPRGVMRFEILEIRYEGGGGT